MKLRRGAEPVGLPPLTRVGHLLIVAGPSGAGKSTFLQRLASGSLPEQAKAVLPAGAEGWLQTDGRKLVRNEQGLAGVQSELAGCCLHYDMLRPFLSEIADYRADDSLRLLDKAEAVTLVMITAPPEQLVDQLLGRSMGRPGVDRWKRLRRRVRSSLLPFLGAILDSERYRVRAMWRQRHLTVAGFYAKPGWVEERYAEWTRFLDAAAGERLVKPIVRFRPVLSDGGLASFELVGAAETADRLFHAPEAPSTAASGQAGAASRYAR